MPPRVSGLQWVSGLQPANGRLDGEAIGNEPVAIELLERRFANRAAILTPVADLETSSRRRNPAPQRGHVTSSFFIKPPQNNTGGIL